MKTANIIVLNGKIPVLVSAPHTYPHRRPSLNISYKPGEPYTKDIAKELNAHYGNFSIYLNHESDYDPNYHKESKNEYKKCVREVVTESKIKQFIDLHGLRDGSDYDIGIYYKTRFSNSLNFAYEVQAALNKGALDGVNIQILRFLDNDQETLGEFVASKLRIPAVQIEIARYIREDEKLRQAFIKNLGVVIEKCI